MTSRFTFPRFQSWAERSRPTGHRWVRSWPRGLATDISSVFTSGPEYDNSNNMHRFPAPAAAPLSICHKPNNSALRPQARNNTCWRDQQLANAFNKPGPRVLFYPENHPKVLVNTSSANPTQIHLTRPCPFFSPSMHFPFYSVAFYLSIALPPSLSGPFFFCLFSTLLPSLGLFVVVASWDLRMRYETNFMCPSGTMSRLESVPAGWNRNPVAALTSTPLLSVFPGTYGKGGSW